jgi:hypothetical protein
MLARAFDVLSTGKRFGDRPDSSDVARPWHQGFGLSANLFLAQTQTNV